ncbi:hypothetical protein [Maribacter stanieri]|uniref:hypothetical protein n=1 Tax=Maribacter stanieri TaxID=440514 RepID=UPI0030DD4E8E|tara:strand:- start:381 stop:887 length:507 start_codon:yes stop_codon:yes gene_type:complete
MPFNLLKAYPDLLEINHLNSANRRKSLVGVFNKGFAERLPVRFNSLNVVPTPKDGKIDLETLFSHLTTHVVDQKTKKREYESHRSHRLHWVRFHLDDKNSDVDVFTVREKGTLRTYIYCDSQKYVVILEPKTNSKGEKYYFLITAYHLTGRNLNKISNKGRRRLPSIV